MKAMACQISCVCNVFYNVVGHTHSSNSVKNLITFYDNT